jgi:hypothetical protein
MCRKFDSCRGHQNHTFFVILLDIAIDKMLLIIKLIAAIFYVFRAIIYLILMPNVKQNPDIDNNPFARKRIVLIGPEK